MRELTKQECSQVTGGWSWGKIGGFIGGAFGVGAAGRIALSFLGPIISNPVSGTRTASFGTRFAEGAEAGLEAGGEEGILMLELL